MNLIRIGDSVINLDLVRRVEFAAADSFGQPTKDYDGQPNKDYIWFYFRPDEEYRFSGADARAAWAAVCFRAAVPELIPAAHRHSRECYDDAGAGAGGVSLICGRPEGE